MAWQKPSKTQTTPPVCKPKPPDLIGKQPPNTTYKPIIIFHNQHATRYLDQQTTLA